jgi:hypothetical protein
MKLTSLFFTALFLLSSMYIFAADQERHEYFADLPLLTEEEAQALDDLDKTDSLDNLPVKDQSVIIKFVRDFLDRIFDDNFISLMGKFVLEPEGIEKKLNHFKEIIEDAKAVNQVEERFRAKIKRIGISNILDCLCYWKICMEIHEIIKKNHGEKSFEEIDVIFDEMLKDRLEISYDELDKMAETTTSVTLQLIPGLHWVISEKVSSI